MELKGIPESGQQKKRFRMLVFVLLMMLIFFLITIFLVSADTNRDDSSLDFSLLSKRAANYGADPHSLVFQPVSLDILFEILKTTIRVRILMSEYRQL